jgi:hypothetical protein
MASAPPDVTQGDQPAKSAAAASSVWPPSMNTSPSGVRHSLATSADRPTIAMT